METKSKTLRSIISASIAGLLSSTAATATDFNGSASVTLSTGATISQVWGPFSFGVIGVKAPADMPATTVVTMTPTSGVLTSNNTSNVLIISDGTPLELQIDGAPANTLLGFTDVAADTRISSGSGSGITLANFISDVPLVTDNNGSLMVKYGADLIFEVNSTYNNGVYSGAFTISINF